jgi:hypothetical protein
MFSDHAHDASVSEALESDHVLLRDDVKKVQSPS